MESVIKKRNQNRSGNTVTTSVSISKEFEDLMEEHKLSPTDIIRKGIAVELYDRGIAQYMTHTNRYRADYVKKFKETLGKIENEWGAITSIMHLVDEIIKLRPIFEEVQKK